MSDDVLVRVEHVSKKFCRSLKRSLWYGLKDLGGEVVGQTGKNRLQLRRDEFLAVDDVSFELRRGECLGLIGANGAGKSTLLRMLNGLIRPDAGCIEINGRVGALIELGAGFNPILSGRENIYVNAAVLGLSRRETDARLKQIVEFAELSEFIDMPVQSYSSGMKVRLGFAVAAHLEPDVLLIDEILAVGDASFRTRCVSRIADLTKRAAVVFVSHSLPLVGRVANRFVVLKRGQPIHEGADASAAFTALHFLLPALQRETLSTGILELKRCAVSAQGTEEQADVVSVQSGDEIRLFLDFFAWEQLPPSLIIVNLLDSEERAIFRCDSDRSALTLQGFRGRFQMEVAIPGLPITSGRYYLSIHVVRIRPDGLAGELILVERNAARLDVRARQHTYALLNPEASWKLRFPAPDWQTRPRNAPS